MPTDPLSILHTWGRMRASDLPGNIILGEAAYRQFLQLRQAPLAFLDGDEKTIARSYVDLAALALQGGVAASSAGCEFPKFLARRMHGLEKRHVLVKFSGNDASPGSQRWADLLVCEHLAHTTISRDLGIDASQSRICRPARCFRPFLDCRRPRAAAGKTDHAGYRGRHCPHLALRPVDRQYRHA